MTYIKILDHPNLVRDTESKAVLNVNRMAKQQFLDQRDIKRKEKERINVLESRIENIENLLQKVLDKLG